MNTEKPGNIQNEEVRWRKPEKEAFEIQFLELERTNRIDKTWTEHLKFSES